jgi:RNA recognition motif-containing protein
MTMIDLSRDLQSGVGKGFGFVTFGDYNDACLSIQAMNG